MTAEIASRPHGYAHANPRILGILWIAYGILRLLLSVWLTLFSTTATLMFGALLSRVPDPFALMSEFHLLYLVLVVWSATVGILGILSGVAFLGGQDIARPLALAAAFLSLSEIPIGIALGVYTLIMLLARPAASVSR
jgi:hypothetical protein